MRLHMKHKASLWLDWARIVETKMQMISFRFLCALYTADATHNFSCCCYLFWTPNWTCIYWINWEGKEGRHSHFVIERATNTIVFELHSELMENKWWFAVIWVWMEHAMNVHKVKRRASWCIHIASIRELIVLHRNYMQWSSANLWNCYSGCKTHFGNGENYIQRRISQSSLNSFNTCWILIKVCCRHLNFQLWSEFAWSELLFICNKCNKTYKFV